MRAAVHHRYGSPEEVITVEEAPTPSIEDDEVLVRVRAAGVNWADTSMTSGKPYVMRLGYGFRGPRQGIRGTDLAGTVERIGKEVTSTQIGDEVFGWSTRTFAEYAAVAADQLCAKPGGISFEQAAGITLAGCVALQALRDIGHIHTGSRVLVNGASGGIGTFTVQIAKAMGAEVTGVCSTDHVALVRSLGADHVSDYTREDFTQGTARYDLILDMADQHSLAARRRVLAEGGTLIPNSGEGGPWFGSVGRILKAWAATPFVSARLRPFLSLGKATDINTLAHMIDDGGLTPVVGATYPLEAAGSAIALAGSGHARGKTVISMAPR